MSGPVRTWLEPGLPRVGRGEDAAGDGQRGCGQTAGVAGAVEPLPDLAGDPACWGERARTGAASVGCSGGTAGPAPTRRHRTGRACPRSRWRRPAGRSPPPAPPAGPVAARRPEARPWRPPLRPATRPPPSGRGWTATSGRRTGRWRRGLRSHSRRSQGVGRAPARCRSPRPTSRGRRAGGRPSRRPPGRARPVPGRTASRSDGGPARIAAVDPVGPVGHLQELRQVRDPGRDRDPLAGQLAGKALGRPIARTTSRGRAARPGPARAPRPANGRAAAWSGDHAVELLAPGDHELESDSQPVQWRAPGAEHAQHVQDLRGGIRLGVVLGGLERDVVTEPVRLLVSVAVAAHVDQERRVVDGPTGSARRDRRARRSRSAIRHWRSTCSIGWPKPRSTPSDRAATSSASRTLAPSASAPTRRMYGPGARREPWKMGNSPHATRPAAGSYVRRTSLTTEEVTMARIATRDTAEEVADYGPVARPHHQVRRGLHRQLDHASREAARHGARAGVAPRRPVLVPPLGSAAHGPGRRALRGPRRRHRGRPGVLHGARSRAA